MAAELPLRPWRAPAHARGRLPSKLWRAPVWLQVCARVHALVPACVCERARMRMRNITCVCTCARPDCTCSGLWTGNPELELTIVDPEYVQVVGDMYDPISSPNDPAFMFHHVNMDRYFTAWQARYADQAGDLWGYPRADRDGGEGYCGPHLLDSVVNPHAPFVGLLEGHDGPYTPRDVLLLTPDVSPYVYDTLA